MTTEERILAFLNRGGGVANAIQIARALEMPRDEVIPTLHAMQESDDIFLRNGWYRVSEKARERQTANKQR